MGVLILIRRSDFRLLTDTRRDAMTHKREDQNGRLHQLSLALEECKILAFALFTTC